MTLIFLRRLKCSLVNLLSTHTDTTPGTTARGFLRSTCTDIAENVVHVIVFCINRIREREINIISVQVSNQTCQLSSNVYFQTQRSAICTHNM